MGVDGLLGCGVEERGEKETGGCGNLLVVEWERDGGRRKRKLKICKI